MSGTAACPMSSIGSITIGGSSRPDTATSTPASEPRMIGFVKVVRTIAATEVWPCTRGAEDRERHRREQQQLQQHDGRRVRGVAEHVDGDRDAEVVAVDVARRERADDRALEAAPPEQHRHEAEHEHHRDGRDRGDREQHREEGTDVGLREHGEQQERREHAEVQPGEHRPGLGPEHAGAPRDPADEHGERDDGEPGEDLDHARPPGRRGASRGAHRSTRRCCRALRAHSTKLPT